MIFYLPREKLSTKVVFKNLLKKVFFEQISPKPLTKFRGGWYNRSNIDCKGKVIHKTFPQGEENGI